MSISTTSDSQDFTLEIPVWVQNKRKWVTGITKKTTFDDLIYALLAQADLLKTSEINQAISGYAIAECVQSPMHEINDSEPSLVTQRIHKGRTKVIKIYKTWQFEKLPLTILQLISTSTTIENSSSSSKLRSKLFRRFLPSKSSSLLSPSQSDSAILPNTHHRQHHSHSNDENQQQKLLNHFQENFAILERQKRLLDYLDEKIHQAEQNSTGTSVTLNDVSRLFSPSAPVQQEQLIFATQLCNSILTVQERLEEKTNLLNHVEQAISNELNQVLNQSHYDTLPAAMNTSNINEKQQATLADLSTLKNSIYRSRELSRIQSKEMHDLDLSLREAEILLGTKYDELKQLEQETSARPNSIHYNIPVQQINHDEHQQQTLAYETLEMALHSMKEIDEDSGINSLTSDDSNHHHHHLSTATPIHQKTTTQLETLV